MGDTQRGIQRCVRPHAGFELLELSRRSTRSTRGNGRACSCSRSPGGRRAHCRRNRRMALPKQFGHVERVLESQVAKARRGLLEVLLAREQVIHRDESVRAPNSSITRTLLAVGALSALSEGFIVGCTSPAMPDSVKTRNVAEVARRTRVISFIMGRMPLRAGGMAQAGSEGRTVTIKRPSRSKVPRILRKSPPNPLVGRNPFVRNDLQHQPKTEDWSDQEVSGRGGGWPPR